MPCPSLSTPLLPKLFSTFLLVRVVPHPAAMLVFRLTCCVFIRRATDVSVPQFHLSPSPRSHPQEEEHKTIQLVGWNRQQEKRDRSLKFAPKNLRSDEEEIKRFEIRAQKLTVLSFLLLWLSNRREPEWSIKGQFGVTSSVTTNRTNKHTHLVEKPRGYHLW